MLFSGLHFETGQLLVLKERGNGDSALAAGGFGEDEPGVLNALMGHLLKSIGVFE